MSTTPAPLQSGFTAVTQTTALAMLSERLGDTGNVFWSLAELRLYLAEALRTWNSYTGWYRDKATLQAKAGVAWYPLASTLIEGSLVHTVTDRDIASLICYHLLEIQYTGGAWLGTDQFDIAAIQNAISSRVTRFLAETGIGLRRVVQQSGIAPPESRALIAGTASQLRRVAWVDDSGNTSLLWQSNEWEMNSFLPTWSTYSDTPLVWSASVTSPTMIQLAPAPTGNGLLDLLLVPSGPALSLSTTATLLGIPDDLTWGIKWGALADLLTADGQAKDIARARYCEGRYNECVQLAKALPAVLQAQLPTGPVFLNSVFDLDAFKPGWQNLPAGDVADIGMAGRTLAVLSPAPATDTNITFDIVRSAAVPASDGAYLQVTGSNLAAVIDYAQHLASFKMAGSEFAATQQLQANMLMAAGIMNTRLHNLTFYADAINAPSKREQLERPSVDVPVVPQSMTRTNG